MGLTPAKAETLENGSAGAVGKGALPRALTVGRQKTRLRGPRHTPILATQRGEISGKTADHIGDRPLECGARMLVLEKTPTSGTARFGCPRRYLEHLSTG